MVFAVYRGASRLFVYWGGEGRRGSKTGGDSVPLATPARGVALVDLGRGGHDPRTFENRGVNPRSNGDISVV